jgi:signal transduction histidine kinase
LEIDDDGRGFDIAADRTGMGLANLEARVSSMDGTFRAASIVGEGTTITAWWPA